MESIAVVKRRGRDFWPCTRGFGGPVCRVGGKLHRAQPLLAPGSQQLEWPRRMGRRCDEPWIRLGRAPTDWAVVTVAFCFERGQRGPELFL